MKAVFGTLAAILVALLGYGQQQPIYTQYIFNPYMINPSLVGFSRQPEVNLLYRQQWTGIKDGPRTVQFDIQYPVNEKIALGLNVFDDKTVLLSNTSAMLTFGYRVPLTKEHIIGFGISAGLISNRLNLDDLPPTDINDPALFNASNSFSFDGQFGVNYNYRNFVLGFSLTKLTNNSYFSQDEFQEIKFDELKNKILYASYKFNVSANITIQPNVAYHFTADDLNYYEAIAFISYKGIIGIGGGYRQNIGPSALIRFSLKNLQIGYCYELPTNFSRVSTGGTNEIQMKYKFGSVLEKIVKEEDPIDESVQQDEEEIQIASKTTAVRPEDESPAQEVNALNSPIQTEDHREDNYDTVTEWDDANDRDWYLIVGTFEKQSNAQKLVRTLAKENVQADIKHVAAHGYYYVHIPAYKTEDITLDKVMEIRRKTVFKDAWYKQLD